MWFVRRSVLRNVVEIVSAYVVVNRRNVLGVVVGGTVFVGVVPQDKPGDLFACGVT